MWNPDRAESGQNPDFLKVQPHLTGRVFFQLDPTTLIESARVYFYPLNLTNPSGRVGSGLGRSTLKRSFKVFVAQMIKIQ